MSQKKLLIFIKKCILIRLHQYKDHLDNSICECQGFVVFLIFKLKGLYINH